MAIKTPVKKSKAGSSPALLKIKSIREIKASLLRPNPFNPKQSFKKQEESVLEYSLKKHGLQGTLTVIPYDWKEPGAFVVLEGNSRSLKLDPNEVVLCFVWEGAASSDDELERLTLDFSIYKKANQSAKFNIYQKYRDSMPSVMTSVFEEIKVSSSVRDVSKHGAVKEWSQKTLIIKFDNEASFLRFKELSGGVTKIIKQKGKLMKALEKRGIEAESFVEKYFLDIMLCK